MRRLEPGENPEVEIGRALTEQTAFEHSPTLAGALEYRTSPSGTSVSTLAVLNEFVPNESDAYSWFNEALARFFEEALSHPLDAPRHRAAGAARATCSTSSTGRCRASSSRSRAASCRRPSCSAAASASCTSPSRRSTTPAFAPEPMNALALRSTYQSMRNTAQQTLRACGAAPTGCRRRARPTRVRARAHRRSAGRVCTT